MFLLLPNRTQLTCLATALLLSAFVRIASGNSVSEVLSALVAIRAEVPASARTATTLGTERMGSGVVIDGDGLVVTVGYIILEAGRVDLRASTGEVVEANILAYDHDSGLGLVRAANPLPVKPMALGSSQALVQADQVLIAGHSGLASARPAVVVDRREFAGFWEYLLSDAIFTSPPHPEFGGAALIGAEGELLGIGSLLVNDAYRGDSGALPGNMFIPVDALKVSIASLLVNGRSEGAAKPWIGVYTEEVEGKLLVRRLAPEGPAASAGLSEGDIITGVGGQQVDSMADFYKKLWADRAPGDSVSLSILKGGAPAEVSLIAGDRYRWLRLE